jgi:hypothetical protein
MIFFTRVTCALLLIVGLAPSVLAAEGDAGSGPTKGAIPTNDAGSGPTKGTNPNGSQPATPGSETKL